MKGSRTRDATGRAPTESADLPLGPAVKICGLTRAEDVRVAADAGAWAVGFVFAPSPRQVTAEQAEALVAEARRSQSFFGAGALTVGVFGDGSAEEIARIVDTVGLDAVQLHGRLGATAAQVRGALAGSTRLVARRARTIETVMVINAVAVELDGDDPEELRRRIATARAGADAVLLDSSSRGRFGGLGVPFPWDLPPGATDGGPFLVAGGISPDNACEALLRSGAWGVDVSSGVESSPGVKSAEAIRRLFEVVNDVRRRRETGLVDARLEGTT